MDCHEPLPCACRKQVDLLPGAQPKWCPLDLKNTRGARRPERPGNARASLRCRTRCARRTERRGAQPWTCSRRLGVARSSEPGAGEDAGLGSPTDPVPPTKVTPKTFQPVRCGLCINGALAGGFSCLACRNRGVCHLFTGRWSGPSVVKLSSTESRLRPVMPLCLNSVWKFPVQWFPVDRNFCFSA